MRRVLFALGVLLFSHAVSAQVAGGRLAVDMPTTESFSRFEVQVDAGAWTTAGLPAPSNDATTLAGHNTYLVYTIPTGTTGAHAYGVRACNTVGCGTPSSITVTVGAPPTNPRNLRFRPPPAGASDLVIRPPSGGAQ